METQQQTVKALKQSVMKITCNPCTLADPSIHGHFELMFQLPQTPFISRPQQGYDKEPRK